MYKYVVGENENTVVKFFIPWTNQHTYTVLK